MSTGYYRLKEPITFLRVDKWGGGHDQISVWVNHGLAGKLTIRKDETKSVLKLFSSDECVLHISFGGEKRGMVIDYKEEIVNYAQVISERGELSTIGEVKAFQGTKQKNEI